MERLALSRKEKGFSPATSLAIRYVVFGMLWILFSDSMLSWVSRDSLLWQLAHIHMLKGVFFIGVTAAALFYFVHNLHQQLVARDRDAANLFDHNPYPLISLQPETLEITRANAATQSLLDAGDADLLQKDFSLLVMADERDRFRSEMALQRVSLQFRKSGTWPVQLHNGKIYSLQISAVHLANAERYQLVLALHNLTPQLTVERELREFTQFVEHKISQRTAQLERLNEELSFRAKETEKVNAELIFINERLQVISRERPVS